MKYWKGKLGTMKEGQMGTMDDTGAVPDAEESTKGDYDAYLIIQPLPLTILERAQAGDRDAIRQLIQAKGGWSTLTAAQKDAVQQLAIGIPATL